MHKFQTPYPILETLHATSLTNYHKDAAASLNLLQISWQNGGVSTKISHINFGLSVGARVWIYLTAVGVAGQGIWSEPATTIVE